MRDSTRMDPDDDAVARAAWRPPAGESEAATHQTARPVADDTTSRATASLLIMRRSVAFIAELAVLNPLVLPLVWALAGDRFEFALGDVELIGNLEIDAAHGVAVIVFLLVCAHEEVARTAGRPRGPRRCDSTAARGEERDAAAHAPVLAGRARHGEVSGRRPSLRVVPLVYEMLGS